MICLYLKIPGKFVRLILKNGFRVMHVPFVCMVKFEFLVPVVPLVRPAVSSCILSPR